MKITQEITEAKGEVTGRTRNTQILLSIITLNLAIEELGQTILQGCISQIWEIPVKIC